MLYRLDSTLPLMHSAASSPFATRCKACGRNASILTLSCWSLRRGPRRSGDWAEGALLLFLFSLGHALEHSAMDRARRAIEALADLAPKTALVHRDGAEAEVPV